MINPSEISDVLKQQLSDVQHQVAFEETGTVLNVGDGVAHVYGLDNVQANELVEFENGVTGVAMNLEESNVGVILLDKVDTVAESMKVRRTGQIASIPVGEGLMGRVINVLGEPMIANADEVDFDTQKDFTFKFELGFAPEINLTIDKSVKVPYYNIEVDDNMVNENDHQLRKSFGKQVNGDEAVEDALAKGSLVELN